MQERLTIVLETGANDPGQSAAIAKLLARSIPEWIADSEDFENDVVQITGNDSIFFENEAGEDFGAQVFYPALREE